MDPEKMGTDAGVYCELFGARPRGRARMCVCVYVCVRARERARSDSLLAR